MLERVHPRKSPMMSPPPHSIGQSCHRTSPDARAGEIGSTFELRHDTDGVGEKWGPFLRELSQEDK